ncbi:hypothetical protein FSOLCH5_008520 [Fusarium solani]
MAIYAVSARFASPDVLGGPASSKLFAQLAMNLNKGSDLTMDELKASVLLYVYEMTETLRWDTVAEIARITRMAELYYALHFDSRPGEPITDLRSLMIRSRGRDIQKRLHELESDCTATSFALPPWFFNATRNLGIAETDEEHQRRLDVLLVWSGANILLSICAAKISTQSACLELQVLWLTISSKANEMVRIIQNWKPGYFKAIDPMCSYLILLAASVLAFDGELAATNASTPSQPSEHLDLLQLFLDQMGINWPVACRLANTLKLLRAKLSRRKPVHEDALNYLIHLTSPLNGTLMCPDKNGVDTQSPLAEEASSFRFPAVNALAIPGDSATHSNGELSDNVDPQLQNYQWLDDFDLASLDDVTAGMDPQICLQQF